MPSVVYKGLPRWTDSLVCPIIIFFFPFCFHSYCTELLGNLLYRLPIHSLLHTWIFGFNQIPLWLLTAVIRIVYVLGKKRQQSVSRPTRQYGGKYLALMTPCIFHNNRYFGVSLFEKLSSSWCIYAFVSLFPSSSLSRRLAALMSQAHCAERSGSDVSVLLALNSRDGVWDDKASLLNVAHFSGISTLTAFITLNISILWERKDQEKQMKLESCVWIGDAWRKKKSQNEMFGRKKRWSRR